MTLNVFTIPGVTSNTNSIYRAGHATMMKECHNQLKGERPGLVVCSVGGGGLLVGVLQGTVYENEYLIKHVPSEE